MNLTVPTVDSNVQSFITGVYDLGAQYLGTAVTASIILIVLVAVVLWVRRAIRRA